MKRIKPLQLVSVAAALVLLVSSAGCGSEQSSGNTAANDVNSVADTTAAETTAAEEATADNAADDGSEIHYYKVGDTFEEDFEICCTKFEDENIPSDLFINIGEDEKMVRAYFTIKNTGEQKDTISSVRFIGNVDGQEVTEALTSKDHKEDMQTRLDNDMFIWDAEVKPGETYGGYIYYNVPADFTHFEIKYFTDVIQCK